METTYLLRLPDGREFNLSGESRVGREPPCEILLDAQGLAPLHATLWIQNHFLYVRDEGSAADTFVNDVPIPAGRPFQLRLGDRLSLGAATLEVVETTAPPVPPPGVTAFSIAPPPPEKPLSLALQMPRGRPIAVDRELRLGHDRACHIRLEDDLISGLHAVIWLEQGVVLVRDVGSTNGTFLNEKRLAPGQPASLRPGDRLRLGETKIEVIAATGVEDSLEPPPPAAPATEMLRETARMSPPPPPAPRPAALALRGPDGTEYRIAGETVVGREPECQIVLAGDARVSRRHARLWVQRGALMVQDESSRNGTFVNQMRLEPGRPVALRPGDTLRFADSPFVVWQPDMGAASATVMRPAMAPAPPTAAPPELGDSGTTELVTPTDNLRRTRRMPKAALLGCGGLLLSAALVVGVVLAAMFGLPLLRSRLGPEPTALPALLINTPSLAVSITGNSCPSVEVEAGTQVYWTNADDDEHFVRSEPAEGEESLFDSGALGPGDSFAFVFTAPGRFEYGCGEEALGTVTVE